jgi:hypothetical protein
MFCIRKGSDYARLLTSEPLNFEVYACERETWGSINGSCASLNYWNLLNVLTVATVQARQ